MTLRQRFFNALSRQKTMTFPVFNSEENETVQVFSVNDPFVSTDKGDIFLHWMTEQLNESWFKKVYESGYTTICIAEPLLCDDLTEDQLDFISRDGCYIVDTTKYQVYARVY